MVNKNLFKSVVYSKGDSLSVCAMRIGTTKDNLSKKLNGKSNFTVDQIKQFIQYYECNNDETMKIFFGI